MTALDFRKFGNKLTLTKMVEVYDEFKEMMTPIPSRLGIKYRIVFEPDAVWITQPQLQQLFTVGDNVWQHWRGIPIVVKGETS